MQNISIYRQGKLITDELLLLRLLQGDVSVFETMCVYGKTLFRLDQHLERLYESAKTTGSSFKQSSREIKKHIRQALAVFLKSNTLKKERNAKIILRVTVLDGEAYVLIFQRKLEDSFFKKGVCLRTSPVRRSLSNASSPEVKSGAYQNGLLAHLEPKPEETYEWLFLDQSGYVTEVSVGNIFIVIPGVKKGSSPLLLTPPTQGILNGVTRQFVIECALQAGIVFKEQLLTRHEIYNAGEAFLTNTSWEILPIAELDRRQVGETLPGKVTSQLQKIFQKKVERECL